MAVWSEINYSKSVSVGRIDAEYYQPEIMAIEEHLNEIDSIPLGELGKIICSAFYPAAVDLYEEGNVPFLRCVDIINHPVITKEQKFAQIPIDFIKNNKSIRCLNPGDIIISKVGTPCFTSLLDESMPSSALSRTVLGLKNIDTTIVDPRYLVVFLRSTIGFNQLMRERELTIQYQLTLERTRNIKVFLPPMTEQKTIGDILTSYSKKLHESNDLFTEAEGIFYNNLNIKTNNKHQLFYQNSFQDVVRNNRIDAEFYQPKYLKSIQYLTKNKYEKLGDIAYLRKGHQSRESEGDTLYASIKDVENYLVDTIDKTITTERTVFAEPNDVVLAITGATIGKTGVNATQNKIAISGDLVLIRSKKIPSYYLLVVFYSKIFQSLCQRYTTGATNGHLSISEINNFPIPIIDEDSINLISSKINKAILLREESNKHLEKAKDSVEKIIYQTRYGNAGTRRNN